MSVIYGKGIYIIRREPPVLEVSLTSKSGVTYTDGLPNDWNMIKKIAKAISEASGSINANTTGSIYVNKGALGYKIAPGDTISVNNNLYAVMGFNNFALTNQNNYGGTHTTAGLTFGAVDCVTSAKMNSSNTNSGGWGKSLMRTSTMPTLQSGMPDTLAQVKVPYVGYENKSVVRYSDDYMFLPAVKEVRGTKGYAPDTEANALTQFAYYKNGGSKIKRLSGSKTKWWLRSINAFESSSSFIAIRSGGDPAAYDASSTCGVAPCFCV